MAMVTLAHTPGNSASTTPVEVLPARGAAKPAPSSLTASAALARPGRRLRVLLVIEAAGGGSGRHVLDLAAGLLRRNHNVCLVYSPQRADAAFRAGLDQLPGLSLHELPMQRSVGTHDLRHARALRALIRQIGPFDLAHAHSSKAGALLRLAIPGLNLPCIYTPHALITLDPDLQPLKRLVYGTAERLLARFAQRIICVSEQELTHATRLGLPASRLCVVHNGSQPLPAPERESVRRELGVPAQAVCIGTVGRIGHQKAMDRLLTAFSMCADASRTAILVIVGDGPDLPGLRRLADELGIRQQVIFAGAGNGPRLMAGFDVFALSSRYEAGPYVLIEAAARNLPIVMASTGGAGSIVLDGSNGFVVPQNDTEAFACSLSELIRRPALRQEMGERSGALAALFSVDNMVDRTVAVYEQVLATTEPPGSAGSQ